MNPRTSPRSFSLSANAAANGSTISSLAFRSSQNRRSQRPRPVNAPIVETCPDPPARGAHSGPAPARSATCRRSPSALAASSFGFPHHGPAAPKSHTRRATSADSSSHVAIATLTGWPSSPASCSGIPRVPDRLPLFANDLIHRSAPVASATANCSAARDFPPPPSPVNSTTRPRGSHIGTSQSRSAGCCAHRHAGATSIPAPSCSRHALRAASMPPSSKADATASISAASSPSPAPASPGKRHSCTRRTKAGADRANCAGLAPADSPSPCRSTDQSANTAAASSRDPAGNGTAPHACIATSARAPTAAVSAASRLAI